MMNFLLVTDSLLIVVMAGVNLWNWFLAMSGYSTIEFFSHPPKVRVLIADIVV